MKKFWMLLISMVLMFSITNISFASNTLVDKAWNIVDAILWAGYAIALGMVVYIGIKYITSAADGKANMKSALVAYCIGAVLVFSATTIAKMVINWSNGSSGNEDTLAGELIDAATGVANGSSSTNAEDKN